MDAAAPLWDQHGWQSGLWVPHIGYSSEGEIWANRAHWGGTFRFPGNQGHQRGTGTLGTTVTLKMMLPSVFWHWVSPKVEAGASGHGESFFMGQEVGTDLIRFRGISESELPVARCCGRAIPPMFGTLSEEDGTQSQPRSYGDAWGPQSWWSCPPSCDTERKKAAWKTLSLGPVHV